MELKVKSNKRLTEELLNRHTRHRNGYEDYDLGWIYGVGKDLVYCNVLGKLKVFDKEYDLAGVLGKKPWDILLKDIIEFIGTDKGLKKDLKSNDKKYSGMCKEAKEITKRAGYILTKVYKKVGFSGYRYEEEGGFDLYYTKLGVEQKAYKTDWRNQREKLYIKNVEDFVLFNRTKKEERDKDIRQLVSISSSSKNTVIGKKNILEKLLGVE